MQNDITTWKRAARTFVQTAVGTILAALMTGTYSLDNWRTWIVTVLASGVSAGMAAVMNYKKEED